MQQTINSINAYVGERLRYARRMRQLSQKELGAELAKPITFQQVQKYERGTNRISVGVLEEFAEALQLPLVFFLPDQDKGIFPHLNKRETELLDQFNALDIQAQDAILALLKNMQRGN